MKIPVFQVAAITAIYFIESTEARTYTQECIAKADYTSCSIFNSCCDFRCSRSLHKRSTCTLNSTGINSIQTECTCTSPVSIDTNVPKRSRHSRLDLIAGILFIFVVDMLIFSFTF